MSHQRMRDLLYQATNGGIVGAEAEELWDLYWGMQQGEAERRRAAIKRDRKRVADLVRERLAPPGAELAPEVAQLMKDIMNGSRARTPRWNALARRLAERLANHAYCERHSAVRSDAECPACQDRDAYKAWLVAGGRDFRLVAFERLHTDD